VWFSDGDALAISELLNVDLHSPVTHLADTRLDTTTALVVVPSGLSVVTLGRRKKTPLRGSRLVVPQYCNPAIDFVENESQDITMVGRPGVIVTGGRGGGWGMEVVACIVGVRMPIPSAFPAVLRMDLSMVEFELVVRVPADSQGCVVGGRGVV